MGNSAAKEQERKERRENKLRGDLKSLESIAKVFHEIGLSDKVTLQAEHHKVSSFLGKKISCDVHGNNVRTLEDALVHHYIHVCDKFAKDGDTDDHLYLFCRFAESILHVKNLTRYVTKVLDMFLIDTDSDNIDGNTIDNFFNTMIYCLEKSLVEGSKQSDKTANVLSPCAYKLDVSDTVSDRYDFEKWLKTKMPMLVLQFPIFVSKVIFDCHSDGYNFQFDCPALTGHESEILTRLDMHVLATMSLNLVKHKPKKLFSTTENGFGFGNLVNALEGYSGPTLLVIKDLQNNVFGGFTCQEWEQRKEFYGTENCFLFSIKPTLRILSPRITSSMNSNFQYLCSKEHHSKTLHGIGFGGDKQYTRLFISSDFKTNCTCRSTGLSFDQGSLRDNESDGQYFTPSTIEIFGYGGEEAEANQAKIRQIRAININNRRQVDKSKFLDGFTQEYLLTNTFKHKREAEDR